MPFRDWSPCHGWSTGSRLLSLALVLWLAVGLRSARAFESNEHREIGTCALALAQMIVAAHADTDSRLDETARVRLQHAVEHMKQLYPDERQGPLCVLPSHTQGLGDWWSRMLGNGTIELDEPGRQIWERDGARTVAYGHIAALVDSYVYPQRLIALRARDVAPAGDTVGDARSATASAVRRGYGALPREPGHLFTNGGRLPWPEDIRAVDVNDSHFRGLAVLSYASAHVRAKEEALTGNFYGALVSSAIADHFLLDLLAPGHVMAARQTVPGELALGMHDRANARGVRFKLGNAAQLENLRYVLSRLSEHFVPLFSRTCPDAAPCTNALKGWSESEAEESARALPLVRTALDALVHRADWLRPGGSLTLRGDNFLTARKMSDANLGSDQIRQYLFVLAVQALSILDVVLANDAGSAACPLPDCAALETGFKAEAAASRPKSDGTCPSESGSQDTAGMDWSEPQRCTQLTPDQSRILSLSTPQVRVCCGTYAWVEVSPSLIAERVASVRSAPDDDTAASGAARWAPSAKSDYRYPDYDPIVGVSYQREYAASNRTPYTLALSVSRLFGSFSGEVVGGQPARAADGKLQEFFDNAWQLSTVSLRLDPSCFTGPCDHVGADYRIVANLYHSPWRVGTYLRGDRYKAETGERRTARGAGLLLELTSTFFRFAVTAGTRGSPLLAKSNRQYGFEFGLFLPQSRISISGVK